MARTNFTNSTKLNLQQYAEKMEELSFKARLPEADGAEARMEMLVMRMIDLRRVAEGIETLIVLAREPR